MISGSVGLAMGSVVGSVYARFRRDMVRAYRRVARGGELVGTPYGPIEYTELGEGPPMLIVHGAGGGYDQGAIFARVIGGRYRWISPSRFGFLGSPVPASADSTLQADAYAGLLDALGIDRVGVVGASMGGPSALVFATKYPHRTTSLAMISAVSHAIPPRPPALAAVFNLFLNDFVFWSMVQVSPRGLLAALGVPATVQAQLSSQEVARLHAFLASIQPMGARRDGQLLEQHMSEYDAAQIKGIRAPTLVLHAPDDSLVAFEQGEYAARHIPGAGLVSMARGGHLALMLDANAGARSQLSQFLAQYNA